MEQEATFRGQHRGSASRTSQGHGSHIAEVESSSLPRNGGGSEHGRRSVDDAGNFDPMTSSSSSGGSPAAKVGAVVEDSIPNPDAVDAEGATAAATHTEFSVEVSYLEIYNESLRDLFNPVTPAAPGGHGGNSGGSSAEWGVGVADSGGGGGGCVSTGSGLRLREDPT